MSRQFSDTPESPPESDSRGRRIAGWIIIGVSAGILAAVAWRVLG